MVTTPSGFVYTFIAGPEYSPQSFTPDSVEVSLESPTESPADSVIGVAFFTKDAFFVDLADRTEGWEQ